jgi:hypothetical protein
LLLLVGACPIARAADDRYLYLDEILNDLRGDDVRLIRWDAAEHTAERQRSGGCDRLREVLSVITDGTVSEEAKAKACDVATLCVTNNPQNRAKLSDHGGIHDAVLSLVSSSKPHVSAVASHLVYIAAFANKKNHQAFAEAGAVAKLSAVVKKAPQDAAVQIMWAAAALQNLAASYCDTGVDDGRCYWGWPDNKEIDHVVIMHDSLPLVSDGSKVRNEMVKDKALIKRLAELACKYGPVRGKPGGDNPYPGENAMRTVAGKDSPVGHETHQNVIAWAAMGALKNAAIVDPTTKGLIDPKYMHCICRFSHSLDWLEADKAEGLLHHLRRGDPCWFESPTDSPEEEEEDGEKLYYYANAGLCVDHIFLDAEGFTCSDYEDPSDEDCEIKDPSTGMSASKACCSCGGGIPGEGDQEETDGEAEEL